MVSAVCGLPHRRVVHLEVTADRSNHDLAGVQAHPDLRLDPMQAAKVFRVPFDGLLHSQGGIARSDRVIFVGERCAEEGHDPVSHHLVDGAFVEVHGLHHALEHRIEDLARLFGITVGQELQRSPEVSEQHRHPLALAFQRPPRGEDLLGEMLWRIGVRRDTSWLRAPAFRHGVPALRAELCRREELAAAIGAGPSQRSGALLTELDLWEILVLAPGALHSASLLAGKGLVRRDAQSLAWQLGPIKRLGFS